MKTARVAAFLPHVRREVEERLARGDYTSLRAFSKELAKRGARIGKSALGEMAQKLRKKSRGKR